MRKILLALSVVALGMTVRTNSVNKIVEWPTFPNAKDSAVISDADAAKVTTGDCYSLTNGVVATCPPVANPDYTYYWWLDSIARKYMTPSQGLPVNPQALTIAILTALNSETNGVVAAKIGSDGTSAAFCYQQLGGDARDYSIIPTATVPQ